MIKLEICFHIAYDVGLFCSRNIICPFGVVIIKYVIVQCDMLYPAMLGTKFTLLKLHGFYTYLWGLVLNVSQMFPFSFDCA